MKKLIKSYFALTKPTIMLLVIVTGAAALFLEGTATQSPGRFFLILLGLYMTGGGANAFNQCFEREIDGQMKRTRRRRPLPLGTISAPHAYIFSIAISLGGVALFWYAFNPLSALLSLGTVAFYGFFYTLILKPNTTQNIVIGGIAGSMGPVIAWAAAAGEISMAAWLMFLIVFFWTPPHFWALAMTFKDDYIQVKLPMLPVVKGDRVTLKHMLVHSGLLLIVSMALYPAGLGVFYGIVALITGVIFIHKIVKALRTDAPALYRGIFMYSISYLFILFFAIIADSFIPY